MFAPPRSRPAGTSLRQSTFVCTHVLMLHARLSHVSVVGVAVAFAFVVVVVVVSYLIFGVVPQSLTLTS